jgi:hypothetical protein
MTGAEQGGRRTRGVGRAAAIGAAAAAVIAAAVFAPSGRALGSPGAGQAAASAAAGTSRSGPGGGLLTGWSSTPADWAPVPYQRAQLSVPGSWLVQSPRQFWCGPGSPGMIFVGGGAVVPKGAACGLTASRAWIRPAGRMAPGIRHRRPAGVIHGIPVYRLPGSPGSVQYLVPELGVRVGARGPLARRVLDTLTRSPLSVVLRRGPAGLVPASWIWHRSRGVRFATPRSWSLQREHQWATCGTGLVPRRLLLIDATRPPARLPCPAPFPTAAAEQAQPGLTVVTGKYAATSVGEKFAGCQVRRGVRICLSPVTGQGGASSGVLIFSASRPHRYPVAFFLLGLSGSGELARAVLGSVNWAAAGAATGARNGRT